MRSPDRLDFQTSSQAGKALGVAHACILPCGSLEQHGPHLPLGTDTMIAEQLAVRLAEAAHPQIRLTRLPALSYGRSPEHADFAGTVSLSRTALCQTVISIARSLAGQGVRRLVLLNAHGGNSAALASILREIREETGLLAVLFDVYASRAMARAGQMNDWHAGSAETSLYAALVDETAVSALTPASGDSSSSPEWMGQAGWQVPWMAGEISREGVIGDLADASVEAGRELANGLVCEMVEGLAAIVAWNPEGQL